MNSSHQNSRTRFAQSDSEAQVRASAFKSSDPFPSIPPALLNSADISDYVAATGMIWPFEDSKERLKSASYLVDILGKCIYWDENGEKKVLNLDKGDEFKLKPNSIVFVTLEPMFRLPNYIALRFNLEIRHIHKGLLLGTGPLVDPGFVGKLLIPLHNLTANEYTFRGGDHIIWMEFTKLSPNALWKGVMEKERKGVFRGFPEYKNNFRDVEYFLEKAVGREGQIRSSIPVAIEEARSLSIQARDYAEHARTDVRRFRRVIEGRVSRFRNLITLAGVIGALALIYPLYSLVADTNSYVNSASKEIPELKGTIQSLEERVRDLEQKLQSSSPSSNSSVPTTENSPSQQANSNKMAPKNVVPRVGNANQQ